MCSKVAYPTQKAANKGARRMSGRFSDRFRAYLCTFCHQYHVTTTNVIKGG